MSAIPTSRIFSSSHIQDLKQHLQPGSLVLCDFDDTLVMTGSKEACQLGGPQWRSDFRKYSIELNQINSLLFEYVSLFIAKSLPPKAVQGRQMAEAIKEWQDMGCSVVVYTARGRSGNNAWYKLNTVGVDLLTNQQLQGAGIALNPHPIPLEHPQVFENRMIFSQNIPKDLFLEQLFDQNVLDPSRYHQIAFADDKEDAVKKLRKPINERGISYVGMHYNYIEELEKKEYHLLKSTIQLVSLLATQKLLDQQVLDDQCDQIEKQGISVSRFFKDVLFQIDQALAKDQVYEQVGLDVEQLFNRIQKAVSAHFEPVDLFVNDLYSHTTL